MKNKIDIRSIQVGDKFLMRDLTHPEKRTEVHATLEADDYMYSQKATPFRFKRLPQGKYEYVTAQDENNSPDKKQRYVELTNKAGISKVFSEADFDLEQQEWQLEKIEI